MTTRPGASRSARRTCPHRESAGSLQQRIATAKRRVQVREPAPAHGRVVAAIAAGEDEVVDHVHVALMHVEVRVHLRAVHPVQHERSPTLATPP